MLAVMVAVMVTVTVVAPAPVMARLWVCYSQLATHWPRIPQPSCHARGIGISQPHHTPSPPWQCPLGMSARHKQAGPPGHQLVGHINRQRPDALAMPHQQLHPITTCIAHPTCFVPRHTSCVKCPVVGEKRGSFQLYSCTSRYHCPTPVARYASGSAVMMLVANMFSPAPPVPPMA